MVPLTLYSKGKTKQEAPKPFPLYHRPSNVVLSHLLDPSTFNIQTAALKKNAFRKVPWISDMRLSHDSGEKVFVLLFTLKDYEEPAGQSHLYVR